MDEEGIRRLAAKKIAIGINIGRKQEREQQFERQRRYMSERKREKWYRTLIIISVAASTIVLKAIEVLLGQLSR